LPLQIVSNPIIGDYDENGINDLEVKFERQELIPLLNAGNVSVSICGELNDGTNFEGSKAIKVINKGKN
jgi:hypothetical protein